MPINIEGGLLVDGQEVGAGGLTSYTATVSFTSDTDGLITYDVVPSDDEFLLSMTVNSNTAANTDLAGSTLNVVMHKSEISMTIEGETQSMLGYAGVLVVGDLSNKFDIFVTLPVGTATSGIIQMKPGSTPHLYRHNLEVIYDTSSMGYRVYFEIISSYSGSYRSSTDLYKLYELEIEPKYSSHKYYKCKCSGYLWERSTGVYTNLDCITISFNSDTKSSGLIASNYDSSTIEGYKEIGLRTSNIADLVTQIF